MPRIVDLRVEFDLDDWLRGDIWAPDGVLAGYVSLRLRGHVILDFYPCGLNNSAISLVRSATQPHTSAIDAPTADAAPWPLFFCAGALDNRCGVIADFDVEHGATLTTLRGFYGCAAGAPERVEVPRAAWSTAVIAFGTHVLRHLPSSKRGVKVRRLPTYRRFRSHLLSELAGARRARPSV